MVNICNGMPTSLNKQHIVGLMLAGRLISRWAFDQQEESFSNKEKKTYSFMFYMIVFATVT